VTRKLKRGKQSNRDWSQSGRWFLILHTLPQKRRPVFFVFYPIVTATTYYLKPDEHAAPPDLAAKGVVAVRGVIADTGEPLPLADDERRQLEDEEE